MCEIWVLGSAAWDVVYEINRIPPTGGRAVAAFRGRRPGGSTGNIARAMASAGHHVHLVTQLGNDDLGDALIDELTSWGIETSPILRYKTCTPEALVFIDQRAERTIIVLDKDCAQVIPIDFAAIETADAIFVGKYSDFDPGLPSVLRSSKALVMTAVPPPTSDEWYAQVVIGSVWEYPVDWLDAPFDALRERVGNELRLVVITQGRHGATFHGETDVVTVPAAEASTMDTTGAGDSFAAGLLHGLLHGEDAATSGRLAARWAAEALSLPQSVPPSWTQLGLGSPVGDWPVKLGNAR